MLRTTALLASLLCATVAHADAVGPADPDVACPEGARVEVNHCGTVCVRRRCETDADCSRPGDTCRDVRLCVEDQPYCGGWTNDPYERIRGDCAGGCGSYECRTLGACVGPASEDAGSPADGGTGEVVTYGCGCRVGAARSSAVGACALVGLLLLGLARRR